MSSYCTSQNKKLSRDQKGKNPEYLKYIKVNTVIIQENCIKHFLIRKSQIIAFICKFGRHVKLDGMKGIGASLFISKNNQSTSQRLYFSENLYV